MGFWPHFGVHFGPYGLNSRPNWTGIDALTQGTPKFDKPKRANELVTPLGHCYDFFTPYFCTGIVQKALKEPIAAS